MLLPLSVADGRLPQVTMTSEWTSTIDDSDGDLNTTTTASFSVIPLALSVVDDNLYTR